MKVQSTEERMCICCEKIKLCYVDNRGQKDKAICQLCIDTMFSRIFGRVANVVECGANAIWAIYEKLKGDPAFQLMISEGVSSALKKDEKRLAHAEKEKEAKK